MNPRQYPDVTQITILIVITCQKVTECYTSNSLQVIHWWIIVDYLLFTHILADPRILDALSAPLSDDNGQALALVLGNAA